MDAVLLTAPDGSVLAANPAACELFGRTEEEICSAGRMGLVDAASPHLKNLLAERERTGKVRGELIFVRGDGSRFPGEVSSVKFINAEGETRTIMIIHDLSEAKRIEREQAKLLFESNKNAAEVEAILVSQDDAILMYDMEMNVRRVNPSFIESYGFDPIGLNVKEIVQRVACRTLDDEPLPIELDDQPTPRALRGEKVSSVPFRVKRSDGSDGIVETSSRPLYVDGKIIGSVTIWHDITELIRAKEELQKSAAEIEDLYENAPCGYHSLDVNGVFIRMNHTELKWLGYRPEEVIGKMRFSDLLSSDEIEVFRERFTSFKEKGYVHNLEYNLIRKDGSTFPVLLSATAIYDDADCYVMSRGTLFDLTERKKLESELKRQARIDMLTGLNNRRHFIELAEQQIAGAKRHDTPLSLLMLDLDNFKLINDNYGHHAGDCALQKLGEVCRHILREIDIVGRFGGEEFAALLPETTCEQALKVAERLRAAVERSRVQLDHDNFIYFTVSIGVFSCEALDADIDTMLKRTDAQLYKAKHAGRNKVYYECPTEMAISNSQA